MRQSTRNQVPITKQREFFHVIPPVNEQRQIATELVGLSEQLQQLAIIYQQKLHSLDELKQSILQEAIQGKLTADWRTQNPNTEPASELLKHIKIEKAQLIKDKKIKK